MMNQHDIKSLLQYDPETGIFTWLPRPWLTGKANTWNIRFANNPAGGFDDRGYVQIRINGNHIRAHILAWIYVYGFKPKELDHINQNKSDNRIANLRELDRSGNMQNTPLRSHNTSGCTGVSWDKRRKTWEAYVSVKHKKHSLGSFKRYDAAVSARKQAEIDYGYASIST